MGCLTKIVRRGVQIVPQAVESSEAYSFYEVDMKLSLAPFAAFAPVAQPRGAGTATPATAPLSRKDEIAARKLEEAKQAVATLAAVKTKSSDAQKARAAQKVKELKARLQALKMLYAGDPKKLARAAAQIARELAGAVKSYTSAGGSAIELGGADAGDASAGGPAPAEADGAAGAPAAAGTEVPPKGAATSETGEEKPAGTTPTATPAENGKSAATQAREKADEEFAREARDLARTLKAALRRKDPKHRDEDDRRSAEQALATVDQTLGALPIADVGAAALAGL